MSHVAVILTSEQCGHCRNMRGSGRLLSKNEIKRDNKQPNIPGGNYYDAAFLKKLITGELGDTPRVRVINIHYKTFNPNGGVSDISVMSLEKDGISVNQTMFKENNGKTQVSVYSIAESGTVISNETFNKPWEEVTKDYIPVNIQNYAMFYPSLLIFDGNAWAEGISKKTPIYGYLNGFETKPELPYGAIPKPQPNVIEMSKFIKQFFDGSKELRGSPPEIVPVPPQLPSTTPEPTPSMAIATPGSMEKRKQEESMVKIQTPGNNKLKFRLYVVE